MTDLPFGFSSSGDDEDRHDSGDNSGGKGDDNPGRGPGGQNPFGFGGAGAPGFDPSAFDPAALGQMFSQLGSLFSGMGSGMSAGGSAGPVNYQLAGNLARQQIGRFTPVSTGETKAVEDAIRLAEVWLDDAAVFPSGISTSVAWTPVQWLE